MSELCENWKVKKERGEGFLDYFLFWRFTATG
jgi:hypothetical protein